MVRHGGNVVAHAGKRIDHRRSVLDFQALHGVGVVGRPRLRRVIKHAGVKASAAAAARLKQNVRKTRRQRLIQAVNAEHIPVEHFPLPVGARGAGVNVRQAPVHVPLHIGNFSILQKIRKLPGNRIYNLVPGKIQHILVPPMAGAVPRRFQQPVRVGTVKLTVPADHLRLKPKAELHAERFNPFGESRHAARQLGRVGKPVPKRSCVVVPVPEPAVVQNKQFNSKLLRFGGKRNNFLFVKFHIGCFPVVDEDGARPVAPAAAGKPRAVKAVERLAHAVKAAV